MEVSSRCERGGHGGGHEGRHDSGTPLETWRHQVVSSCSELGEFTVALR